MGSQGAPFSIFRGCVRDWYGHISFTHMGPIVRIPDISLQPITDVQPLTSKAELMSPMEQKRMGRHIDVLGHQRKIQSPLIPGPQECQDLLGPTQTSGFPAPETIDVRFTSNDPKFSLITSICTFGTGKSRRSQTGPQSHTGWAMEGC